MQHSVLSAVPERKPGVCIINLAPNVPLFLRFLRGVREQNKRKENTSLVAQRH